MKNLKTWITALAVMLFIASCDELPNLLDVTFENVAIEEVLDLSLTDLSTPRTLSLTASMAYETFNDSIIIGMNMAEEQQDSTEEELADYLNKLSEVSIDTFFFEVLETYNDVTLPESFEITTLNLEIKSSTDSLIHSETVENIKAGDKVMSNITNTALDAISRELEGNRSIKIKAWGEVTGNEDIEIFGLKTKIIADIKSSL